MEEVFPNPGLLSVTKRSFVLQQGEYRGSLAVPPAKRSRQRADAEQEYRSPCQPQKNTPSNNNEAFC